MPAEEPRPVAPGLRTAAGYAWRLLVVGAAGYAVFVVLGRFHQIGVALFLALVLTALLRPVADRLARLLPRAAAVAITLIGALVLILGVPALVGETVAGESESLVREFEGGLDRIRDWLAGPPFHVDPTALTGLQDRIGTYLAEHRGALVSQAVTGAGRLAELVTTAVLGLFCAVFLVHSGDRHWRWFVGRLPRARRERVRIAGRAAWRTFTGYTHGIVIVAGTNAVLVGIALYLLGVPLALPLALLEFLAAFVPLVGSPVALAVAAVVALATRGPVVAGVVIALIVVIGQFEGHVLHPLVMSRAVSLHPVIVALSVVAGAISAGVVGAVVAVPLVSVAWAVHEALAAEAASRATPGPVPDAGPDPPEGEGGAP
ncbi:AI-2E family transporter [Streptomyces sp. BI20]|uniref:AI-2E family transporter n=1 Tax=Streptomyces sp. BI20 TaxID=3403460 RepID=UPI003C7120E7